MCLAPSITGARAENFKGDYVVSYLGLTIARSSFDSQVDANGFVVNGTVASAGIATIFDRTKGVASVSGKFGADAATRPDNFRMEYSEGKRKQVTALGFTNGAVTRNENVPPLKSRDGNWVPTGPADIQNVMDPLSGGLVKASSPEQVCNRTLRLFDGELRLDVTLRPAPLAEAAKKYGPGTVTCRASAKAVAGYRKGRRALDYLEKRSKISMSFAPLGVTGIYAPVYATIGTEIGTITVRVKRR